LFVAAKYSGIILVVMQGQLFVTEELSIIKAILKNVLVLYVSNPKNIHFGSMLVAG
jgi:hypothetical protein